MKLDMDIVPVPPPRSRDDSLVAQMQALYKGQSFTVPNKSKWTRSGLYVTARRAKVKIATRFVEALNVWRVWRMDGDEKPERRTVTPDARYEDTMFAPGEKDSAEVPMTHKEKLDGLRDLMGIASSGVKASEIYGDEEPGKPIDEWAGWSEERETLDQVAGETVYYREHIKTRKRKEIRRETYYG